MLIDITLADWVARKSFKLIGSWGGVWELYMIFIVVFSVVLESTTSSSLREMLIIGLRTIPVFSREETSFSLSTWKKNEPNDSSTIAFNTSGQSWVSSRHLVLTILNWDETNLRRRREIRMNNIKNFLVGIFF